MEPVIGSSRDKERTLSERLADWERRVREELDRLIADVSPSNGPALADETLRQRVDAVADLFLEADDSLREARPKT